MILFMEIMWTYLMFLSIVGATGRYGGSSSRHPIIDYTHIEIPSDSAAAFCMRFMNRFCGVLTEPTKDNCAYYGVLYWSKDTDAPVYIKEYFDMFKKYLIPGDFKLPDEFCDKNVQKYFTNSSESAETIAYRRLVESYRCKGDLSVLKALEIDPAKTSGNIYEMGVQSRKNILHFLFYDTTLDNTILEISEHILAFMKIVAELTQVNNSMPSPKKWCLTKFPPVDSITQ